MAQKEKNPRSHAGASGDANDDALIRKVLPVFADYLRRVGADVSNFRKAVVYETTENGYRQAVATIVLRDGGQVECLPNKYASTDVNVPEPTEKERKAIAKEFAKAKLPKSISYLSRGIHSLTKQIGGEAELYLFLDQSGKNVVFVQQRIRTDSGEKVDLPWSFWSDGQWRRMEPDDELLPVFGLEVLNGRRIMIHEGAATARAVQRLCADKKALAQHPWGAELARYNHVGWPAGAPNPHRVDFAPIRSLPKDTEVVLACDRDRIGELAAPKISRVLQRPMEVLRFGIDFDEGFDLADEFPPHLYKERNGRNVYVGPSLIDCLGPGTWATKLVPGKKDKAIICEEFAREWLCVVKPKVLVHRNRVSWRFSDEEFNDKVRPFSHLKDTAGLLRKQFPSQVDAMVYEPGHKSGPIALDRQHVVNVYEPSSIKPKEGDVGPLLDFMEHLIPDPRDRAETLRWCATLIARPDVRMKYGLLLISEAQGVGKTTLAEKVLAPLVGLHNTSFPTAQEATQSDFNGWSAFKRLAVIGELYDGATAKAYNRLKQVMTDNFIRVNEKYEKQFEVSNYVQIVASSNSLRPLKFDNEDRRWLVPTVTDKKKDVRYWRKLNEWLTSGGLEAIAWWARQQNHVLEGEEAPKTTAKHRSVLASMSDGERLVHDLGMNFARYAPDKVMRTDEVRPWLQAMKASDSKYGHDGSRYLETPEKIASVLKGCGLKISTKQFQVKGSRKFRVVATSEIADSDTWGKLQERHITPAEAYALGGEEGKEAQEAL